MASLPPVVVGNTVKLETEFKRLSAPSLPFEKKNYSTKEGNSLTSNFKEAVSLTSEGNRKLEPSSYFPILQECMLRNSVSEVESIHAHIIKSGFLEEFFLMTFLVNVYGKCGKMGSARKVFDDLPERNAVAWTSLMSGYLHNSLPELAISIFDEMLEEGVYPTDFTLGVILSACTSSLCDINYVKQIHGYIIKYGLETNQRIGNALCSLYSKCRNLVMAIKAFERIEEKNVISWTAIVSAYGDNGNSAKGLEMFVKMLVVGVEPNEITLTTVLSLCCTMQALDAGSQVHSLIIKLGFGSEPLKNSIMYLYLKSGCISEAKKLFVGMDSVTLVSWNTMIAGHAEMISRAKDALSAYSYGIEALQIFHQMNGLGLKPDLYTFSSLLSVCSSLVSLEHGEQVHAQAIKTGILSDVIVATSLVNMYNKCGSINRASKAFVEMPTRTLISWTSMITAFSQHGLSEQALQVFEDMRLVGVKPNKITFVGVLSACSQAGMVDQAFVYYNMMKYEYKINPVIDHYSCMIDMFVRLNRVEEAFDFVKKSNLTPNEFIWSILIAGCRSQGKLELAFHAAEQLLELEPRDSETYLLLLNMYISAERWTDVSRVRKMMRDVKIDKIVDWSWISIRNKVYSFKKHQPAEVARLLDDLIERAKALGYKAETNLQTDEEEEEATTLVAHHSEKLAVAFGLLNTTGKVQIRVTKNTCMCRDCHNFIKLVSILTSRTIIVRDRKRLHKFQTGQCSCKDFGGLV